MWAHMALVLVALTLWLDGAGGEFGYALAALLVLGGAWPGLRLLARRLREPSDLDVLEADGRAPVLLLHSFERARVPLWRRLTPRGFLRDRADERLERSLRASLVSAGPVLALARPEPPPSHGRIASLPDHAPWEEELRRRAKAARIVAIVVDGTDANRRELQIVSGEVDIRRVILVLPSDPDEAFWARWETLRAALPGLPALSADDAAVRFDGETRPLLIGASGPSLRSRAMVLASPSLLLRAKEIRPAARVPIVSWIFSALPALAGLFATLAVPLWLALADVRIRDDEAVPFGALAIFCGIWTARESRRVMRLVPGSELPMVFAAALPWLATEAFAWGSALTRSHRAIPNLEPATWGAACSSLLLLATAFTLAGASLMRKSPGRHVSYAVFGAVALIPLVALVASLGDAEMARLAPVLALLFVGAIAMAAATLGASGEAGRRHAPLTLGSATCAALSIFGALGVATHRGWSELVVAAYEGPHHELTAIVELAEPITFHDRYVALFVLALPLVVVGIASPFRGRSNRHSTASALTLIPLVALLGLVSWSHSEAEAAVAQRATLIGRGAYARAAGGERDLELPAIVVGRSSLARADAVVDLEGLSVLGRRVATAADLTRQGGPALGFAVDEAIRARRWDDRVGRDILMVAADRRVEGRALVGLSQAAAARGVSSLEVMGENGASLRIRAPIRNVFGVRYFLLVSSRRVQFVGTDGTSVDIPDRPAGGLSPRLSECLVEHRQRDPSRRDIHIAVAPGVSTGRVMEAATVAYQAGFDELAWTELQL